MKVIVLVEERARGMVPLGFGNWVAFAGAWLGMNPALSQRGRAALSPAHAQAGPIGRFVEHVGANAYWDFYESTTDMRLLGKRTLGLLDDSSSIHFNLDGMTNSGRSLKDVVRWGEKE